VAVVVTREPGGTVLGERIREVLLGRDGPDREPLTDALLFNAARRQLVSDVIRPALERGEWVLCDRFADSTLAYQGFGAGAPPDELRAMAEIATGGLKPVRTLLFDLPVEQGLARRAGGPGSALTRFELAERFDIAFHQRVRDGYLELARAEPERWRMIDASSSPELVAEAAWRELSDLLPRDRHLSAPVER
jgi:dTMP kinase